MKKKEMIFVFGILVLTSCACNGVQVNTGKPRQFSKSLAVTEFDRIQEEGSMDIVYIQDSSCSVRIVGPEDRVRNVTAKVSRGTLVLSEHDHHQVYVDLFSYDRGLTAYISSPNLLGVGLSGSGDFSAKGKIDTDDLEIALKGSGDADFGEIICDRLQASLSGSGDLKISRLAASTLFVDGSGSGDVSLGKVRSWKVLVDLSGSGDASLALDHGGEVGVTLSGSGDLTLKGNWNHLQQRVTGSGEVNTVQSH